MCRYMKYGGETGRWGNRDKDRNRSGESFKALNWIYESRDGSVGITLGYVLDDRGSIVRFLAGAGNFYLHHRVQNGSGAHASSYPVGNMGSFSGGKAAEA
jgi:hypothetical protein